MKILRSDEMAYKKYCKWYYQTKITIFTRMLLHHLSFSYIFKTITQANSELKYKCLKKVIGEVVHDQTCEIALLEAAFRLFVDEIHINEIYS